MVPPYKKSAKKSFLANIKFYSQSKGSSPPFNLALDIGCGSGQATATLVQHFDRIAAFDVSEAQIAEANRIKEENGLFQNVEFR